VTFRLLAAEDITWWKGLLVPDGLGSSWEIWTENATTAGETSLWANQVHNQQLLEFKKAKLFGVHTGVYQLGDLGRLAPGTRVTFQWAQDEAPVVNAWAWRSRSNLSLPAEGGRFLARAGQTFDANLTFQNITETYPWTYARRYKLKSWDPPDNTTWGLSRVELPHRVDSFGYVTFSFGARAPSTPGIYPFNWRMVQEGVAAFGEVFRAEIEVVQGAGSVDVTLMPQAPGSPLYAGASLDPSGRHATIVSVRNGAAYPVHLAHQDRTLKQTDWVLLPPNGEIGAPFATLEVEGAWRMYYRGPTPPPAALTLSVNWRI
jgi:hypothetical protein